MARIIALENVVVSSDMDLHDHNAPSLGPYWGRVGFFFLLVLRYILSW